MLSHEDNERLVRVGRGQPAGELFRRYWQPALLSSELPSNDCPPVRVRLLGENLIAFRDTVGRVGLLDAYCPHRRAPLFFGRNEECGLRCVYHGWKFDADGNCVEVPTEPSSSAIASRIKITAYPTHECGGVVWAYMGPKETMPEPPDYEWTRAPATHRFVSKTVENCNYLQGLEGGLDTSHSSFLHNHALGNTRELRNRDGAPKIDVETTDYGYCYISTRRVGEDARYVRVYHFVMPNQQMRGSITALEGGKHEVPKLDGHIWVPIDDEHTHVYNWAMGFDESVPLTAEYMEGWETWNGRGSADMIPGTFHLKRSITNDYLIDRELQRTRTSTGIKGVNTQDFAVQEGMGPIVDRTKEHLGSSDAAIATTRRLLLLGTRDVESGKLPRGADPQSHREIRPYDDVILGAASWREAFASELTAKW
jgi:phenylpropionate dioxygenase-like ring-hydroxylating dioxygenase large terminal subunit